MRVIDEEVQHAPTASEIYANAVSHGKTSGSGHILAAAFSNEEFGRRLVRLKFANEADEYEWCLQRLRWEAQDRNKRKWNADNKGCIELAKQVMDYWIADTCPQCLGRGAKQIEGTPHLSTICPACTNGIRAWSRQNKEWEQRGAELLSLLDENARRFGGAVYRLMRSVV